MFHDIAIRHAITQEYLVVNDIIYDWVVEPFYPNSFFNIFDANKWQNYFADYGIQVDFVYIDEV